MQSSFNSATSTLLGSAFSNSAIPSTDPLQHLVFVDSRLSSFDAVTANLPATRVIALQSDRNSIDQITEVISQYSNLESVHILSHGADGELLLGDRIWNQTTLASQRTTLQSWARHFSQDADILLYGCNLASSAEGLELVQSLSQLTGADVAASDDITGSAALGGDWDLEVKTGAIESDDLLSVDLLAHYQGTLATYNGNSYRLTNGAKTWEEAQAEASSLGGNLVTINDAAEQAWLQQTFGTEGFWIGLSDRRIEGTFEWVSGETSTYRNWAPGEPNDAGGNQDYALMNFNSTGQWDDDFPTVARRGIIEISPTYNGNSYRLTTGAKTWEEAQAEARSVGGNLVTINDSVEEAWLRQTFGTERLWIGLSDRRIEGTFEWVSGETPTYRNWAPGEPNDFGGNQDYGLMNFNSTGQWDDDNPTAA